MTILAECPFCRKWQSVRNKLCDCGADLDKLKRGQKVKYWISYRLPGGKQRREPVAGENLNPYSIESAREMHSKRVVQKKEKRIFDIKPDAKMTFHELTEWYLGLEKVKPLSSFWRVKIALDKFNSVFGDWVVGRTRPADLENYQQMRKDEGLADATIDQEVGAAKTMIIKGFDNDMVGGDTLRVFKSVKKLLKLNGNARDRVLSRTEFEDLREHAPRHLKPMLATAYFTGMREGEILNLTWDRVDLKARVIRLQAEDTKDKEPMDIPICDELWKILETLPRGIRTAHVFLYKGKPVRDIRNALQKACEGAGISYGRFVKGGFVFHDLRRTFNTNMRKAGIPESVIMAVTGHSTRSMFDRYNKIDMEDTRNAVARLEAYLANVDQTVDQNHDVKITGL